MTGLSITQYYFIWNIWPTPVRHTFQNSEKVQSACMPKCINDHFYIIIPYYIGTRKSKIHRKCIKISVMDLWYFMVFSVLRSRHGKVPASVPVRAGDFEWVFNIIKSTKFTKFMKFENDEYSFKTDTVCIFLPNHS